jgi:hypothetical protein
MAEPKISVMPSEDKGIDKRFLALPNNEILFKPPFTCAIIGAIGAGKTSFGYSLMNDIYKNYFDEVVIMCGTLDSKKAWENINQRAVIFLDHLDEDALKMYMDQLEKDQLERQEKNKFPVRVAMVLDDVVFEGFNKNRVGYLEKLLMVTRHLNVSIIFMLQHSKMISAAMRNQIFYYVLMRVTTNDLEKIADEHANHLTSKEFKKLYHSVQSKGKHEFMIIDYKAPYTDRFRHRFTTIIGRNKMIDNDNETSSEEED